MLLSVGCARDNEEQLMGFTVLNKEMKGDSYIIEVSNQERHEYIELSKNNWNRINIGDTVSLDPNNVLVRINNTPIDRGDT
jgi:uncharacterized protein YacL (UPF0231 family)